MAKLAYNLGSIVLLMIAALSLTEQRNMVSQANGFPTGQLLDVSFLNTPSQNSFDQRISELSKQISDGLAENQKRTIAVAEFADLRGNVTNFGRFIAEELITRLYQTKKFKVIERQLLNKVIAEQKLSLSGVIEQSSAQRLGKVLGVDAIASGTVTDLGKTLRVNARLIDTSTGEIFGVESTEIVKDESVLRLLSVEDIEATGHSQPENSSTKAVGRVEDFIFEIKSCNRALESVTCKLSVKNDSAENRRLHVETTYSYNPTRLLDESGNEYLAKSVQLGAYAGNTNMGISNTFISQISTVALVKFENVSIRANKVTLSIGFRINNHNDLRVTLRNIPMTK